MFSTVAEPQNLQLQNVFFLPILSTATRTHGCLYQPMWKSTQSLITRLLGNDPSRLLVGDIQFFNYLVYPVLESSLTRWHIYPVLSPPFHRNIGIGAASTGWGLPWRRSVPLRSSQSARFSGHRSRPDRALWLQRDESSGSSVLLFTFISLWVCDLRFNLR